VATGAIGTLELVDRERAEGGGEVRDVSEWAQVRALAADGVSQREIAARLGMNRRTVKRLSEAAQPPCYRREATGSMLDPVDAVLRRLVSEHEDIKAPRVTDGGHGNLPWAAIGTPHWRSLDLPARGHRFSPQSCPDRPVLTGVSC
jgi:hypothetical protein